MEWIGEIPENWDALKVKYILNLKNGTAPDFDEDGKYDIIGSNGKIGKSNRYNLKDPHIIIGRVGACGSVNISPENAFISDNAFIIDLKQKKT